MSIYNPFEDSFEQAKNLDKYTSIILWLSTILLVTAFVFKSCNSKYAYISDLISKFNCVFIVIFIILTLMTEYIFYNASVKRRSDFIDNSFDSSFAEDHSVEYYTNADIDSGVYKMAVNGFENSLFTYCISKKMLKAIWFKNVIFALLFIILAILGLNNAFVLGIQLSLPLILLQQAIKLTLFVSRIDRVYENFRRLFNDLKDLPDSKSKKPEIILNVIDYETTLTYGSILLDTKIYNKLNLMLSERWENMKQQYNIISNTH